MLKICLALAVLLVVGLFIFPQLRVGAVVLLPFAPLVLCLLICPLVMYFGMRGMKEDKDETQKHE